MLWTDVFQLCMILVGMFFIVIKGFTGTGGIVNAFHLAQQTGRLNLFE